MDMNVDDNEDEDDDDAASCPPHIIVEEEEDFFSSNLPPMPHILPPYSTHSNSMQMSKVVSWACSISSSPLDTIPH